MAKHTLRYRTILSRATLGIFCSVLAFAIGMETAGEVQPFERSQAALADVPAMTPGMPALRGDANENGVLDVTDVIRILEVAEGLETADAREIQRLDTDGDFRLTVKDALRVLHQLSRS